MHMKLGEASYFFLKPSQNQNLLCKMFGGCSGKSKACFCNKYICLFLDLLQINSNRKLNAKEHSEYIPALYKKRYKIIIDLVKEDGSVGLFINQFNYIMLLIESEMKHLLHDLNGDSKETHVLKHWYTMNKNIKNYRKVHDLMNNLELHYQRMVFINHLLVNYNQDQESVEAVKELQEDIIND